MARPLTFPLLALALAASACTQHAEVDSDRLGPGYVTGGGEWSSGGGITVAVRALERDGVTVICGAWTTDQQSALSANLNESVMDAGSIDLGGKQVVQNLGFMPRHPYGRDLTGASSRCVASKLSWQPEFAAAEPVIRLPRISFSLSRLKRKSVTFRPSARPAILP